MSMRMSTYTMPQDVCKALVEGGPRCEGAAEVLVACMPGAMCGPDCSGWHNSPHRCAASVKATPGGMQRVPVPRPRRPVGQAVIVRIGDAPGRARWLM